MVKKIFVRAKVVKGLRWFIEYTMFNPLTAQNSRHRREFDLNRIKNLEVREEVAKILCNYLEELAPAALEESFTKNDGPTLRAALDYALGEKLKLPRKNSHRSYKSVHTRFITWAARVGCLDRPAMEFGNKQAREFWTHTTGARAYRGATLNNIKIALTGLWTECVQNEMVKENPWKMIRVRVLEDKLRRPFTEQERRAVALEAFKTDYWLFRSILLQFYCYIRPVEICRLRFRDFNLQKGTVTVTGGNAKKWKGRTVTIPASVMHFFKDGRFDQYPVTYYMLGKIDLGGKNYRLEPSGEPVGDDRMYKRHKKLLERLYKSGQLETLQGLTYYSWKDTGISLHARSTTVAATKDQAGHTNFAVTSLYYHAETYNAEYGSLEADLF